MICYNRKRFKEICSIRFKDYLLLTESFDYYHHHPHHQTKLFPQSTINCSLRMYIMMLLLLSSLTYYPVNCSRVNPERRLSSRIVTTKYGALRGFITTLPGKVTLQPVEVFLGIPYASPPVGKLRFMPPVTPAYWNGVRSAHSPGPVCPQNLPNISNETEALKTMTSGRLRTLRRLIPMLLNQSEDCLYLNIFTPSSPASKENTRLPVIVVIHGESYEWNAGSSYDGSVLASFGNVVVVTINYRLGVLGFFPALDGSSRGNFGLMDQVAALHWIQENIAEFGGDPSNVTIFGHSHGAACVNILMLTPMAKGLFHRAIMHSGSALSPWAMATDAVGYSRKLAAQVGCPDEDDQSSAMIDCLRSKEFKDLISVNLSTPNHLTSLGPTVDGIVIPDYPENLMITVQTASLFGSYDLLLGITNREYFSFSETDESNGIDTSKQEKIVRTFVRNLFNYHLQEIFHTIVNEYTDWTKFEVTPREYLNIASEILSDGIVTAPLIKVAHLHSKSASDQSSSSSSSTSSSPVYRNTYLYTFEYSSKMGDYPSLDGCVSGEELAYIFGSPLVPGMELGYFVSDYTDEETILSARIISYWTNFAKFGGQSNELFGPDREYRLKSLTELKEMILWPRYDERLQQYLSITLEPSVKDHYRAHRLSVWLNLIPKLHIPGPEVFSYQHHLLSDHDNLSTYEGVVRETPTISFTDLTSDYDDRKQGGSNHKTSSWPSSSQIDGPGGAGLMATSPVSVISVSSSPNLRSSKQPKNSLGLNNKSISYRVTGDKMSTESGPGQSENPSVEGASNEMKQIKDSSSENSFHFNWNGPYSTALSVTIAIGCTFLILNGLIFAAFFYKKGRSPNRDCDVNDSTTKDSSQAPQSHPSSNPSEANIAKSTLESPFKLTQTPTSLGLNSGGLIADNTGLGSASPSLKTDNPYTADYIASVTGQHGQMISISGEMTQDLLDTCTGGLGGPRRLGNVGSGGTIISSGHVSMCNSVYYPDKCPTLPRMGGTTLSSNYRTISQSKFPHLDEPREFHEMNI